jgi:hypothetical protein
VANLSASASTVLNASGGGQAFIGPQNAPGTQSWHVTGILVKTSRPGVAPIPACDVYLDNVDPGSIVATMYDGSRNQGSGDQILVQGQRLIAVWAGGQSGDVATLVLSGTRGD